LTIETSKILYFYTEQKITRAVIYNNEYLLDFSIEDIQNMIHPDAFFRVSRQHIINRNAIQEVTIWFNGKLMIKIKNEANTRIEVSKARVQDFKKWLAM
jgi:DNA-binding LytR/AlgR family response regulator